MKKVIKFLIRNVNKKYLLKMIEPASKILSLFYRGSNIYCPICNKYFKKFLPYGVKPRENALCPGCFSLERHRLIWLYLKNQTNFFKGQYRLLHVAPEPCLYKKFIALHNINYTTIDLESPLAMIKADIHNIPCQENKFDIIICSDVLEHVKNDKEVMKELYRVLKRGGWAILRVPIDKTRIKTLEDNNITSPLEREKYFGQKDHVRLYGLDFLQRFKNSGFRIEMINPLNKISKEMIERYKLPQNELIYLAKK